MKLNIEFYDYIEFSISMLKIGFNYFYYDFIYFEGCEIY